MTHASAPDPVRALQDAMARDRGRILAALIRELRDFQLAEDSLQDAAEAALLHWARSGVPARADGWLLRVARRKAIDRLRRAARFRAREPDIATLARADEAEAAEPPPEIPDERLRLIFTCCHPALEGKTRVALTLRTICGLTTGEIARAFLDQEPAMGQRLSRAKAKIARAGIAYEVPGADLWAERMNSVLTVIYLIFNEGYSASSGESPLRVDLCDEAIFLARLIDGLAPGDAEIGGLLALLLLLHSRRAARIGADGVPVALDAQDRGLWDRAMMEEGLGALDRAIARGTPGPFQIKAAINALHATAPDGARPDWRQIALLYGSLLRFEDTPVVRLNRAVAVAETGAVDDALAELDRIGPALADYQPYHAAVAELAHRVGRSADADAAYARAIALSRTTAERMFLIRRRDAAAEKKRPSTKLGRSPTGR